MDGEGFKAWRKRVGLTQDGVTERLPVSRSTVQNWESGSTPISYAIEQALLGLEHRLRQEDGGLGPVTLTYADGPMWIDAYSPSRIAMLQREPYRTNSDALGRVLELTGSAGFHVPFVVLENDEVLWNSAELRRVGNGNDDTAPIPVRWRAKVITNIAEYLRRVAIRFPVRSGPRLWTAEETAVWETKVRAGADALDALAAEVPTGAVTFNRVDAVLLDLREHGVFPPDEHYRQLVVAFWEAPASHQPRTTPMDQDLPRNHAAYGALDADGQPYIVLEPRRHDHRLERAAFPVSGTLATAEQHADAFNRGHTSFLRVHGGQRLTGADIPTLFPAPRDGWKQCTVPLGAYTDIQDRVADRHLALTARSGSIPEDYALFTREDDDFTTSILLLSPEAAADCAHFGGQWVPARDVDNHGWALLYGDTRVHERMGLRYPSRYS